MINLMPEVMQHTLGMLILFGIPTAVVAGMLIKAIRLGPESLVSLWLFRSVAVILVFAVSQQWASVGERIYHAYRMYHKFGDVRSYGYTDMSIETTIGAYVISALLIALSIKAAKVSPDRFSRYVTWSTSTALIIGVIAMTALIASPVSKLVWRYT